MASDSEKTMSVSSSIVNSISPKPPILTTSFLKPPLRESPPPDQPPRISPYSRSVSLLNDPACDHELYYGIFDGTVEEHISKELDVSRLEDIQGYLWLAGRQGNIRPLHKQYTLQRKIVLSEQTDLHLLWDTEVIFIKPLPYYLLDFDEFEAQIRTSSADNARRTYETALGLLYTYTELIRHRSDLDIALELKLLPAGTDWAKWRAFSREVRDAQKQCKFRQTRFKYGELRLDRINTIYRIRCLQVVRGYHAGYTKYSSFFRRNFSWVVLTFLYLSTALSAFQVLLASNKGIESYNFQMAAYAVSVASIILVVMLVVLCLWLFFSLVLYHLFVTLVHMHNGTKKKVTTSTA